MSTDTTTKQMGEREGSQPQFAELTCNRMLAQLDARLKRTKNQAARERIARLKGCWVFLLQQQQQRLPAPSPSVR